MNRSRWPTAGAASAAALLLTALLALAWLARSTGTERVVDTLSVNAQTLSTALRVQFERALTLGIPLEELPGVEPLLAERLSHHREVVFFALLSPEDAVQTWVPSPQLSAEQIARWRPHWPVGGVAQAVGPSAGYQVVRTPIQPEPGGPVYGWLVTGFDPHHIDRQVNAVVGDLLVAILVALVVVLEGLRLVSQRPSWGRLHALRAYLGQISRGHLGVQSPLQGPSPWAGATASLDARVARLRQRWADAIDAVPSPAWRDTWQRWGESAGLGRTVGSGQGTDALGWMRAVVFLVALSDELVRPFLAVLASSLPGPASGSPSTLAGITLSTFLLTWALSQPFGAGLLQRYGSQRCLGVATGTVALSLLATAWAPHWWALTGLRALTGVGFGLVLIFSQTLMLRVSQDRGRALAMGEFVAAVVAAGMCGPVMGGLMQVKLGTAFTLGAAASCALVAWVLARQIGAIEPPAHRGQPLSWRSLGALVRYRPLLGLLVCSAIPGKLAATSVLLLWIPLSVSALGESASTTGRLLLLYFLAFWLVASLAGRRSDRQNARKPFVLVGGVLSALGCGVGFAWDSLWGLAAAATLLGLGQAWLSSPQIVWATQMADQNRHAADAEVTLGVYRLVERFGGAVGPVVVAAIGNWVGLQMAMLVLAGLFASGTLATWLWLPESKRHRVGSLSPTLPRNPE